MVSFVCSGAEGRGKHLLRRAFQDDGLLPEANLRRENAAFSDAAGPSARVLKNYGASGM